MHLYHPDWTIAMLCIRPFPVIDELTAAGSTCHKITDRYEKEGQNYRLQGPAIIFKVSTGLVPSYLSDLVFLHRPVKNL